MNDERRVIFVGPSDAGKSNYLFRLGLAMHSGNCILRQHEPPSDAEYIQSGLGALLQGQFAPRTSQEVHEHIDLPFKCEVNGQQTTGRLLLPDCPGEKWLGIYQDREWSEEWETLISASAGVLLFIRPNSDLIVRPLDWITYHNLYGASPRSGASGMDKGAIPTQILLVEWLQFLRRAFDARVGTQFVPHVGLMVSAWDRLPHEQQNSPPEEYLATNFPLLHQFIRANSDAFQFHVFGVSIFGGDLDTEPGFREALLSGNPCDAGYVFHTLDGELRKSPDVTLPVLWVTRLLNNSNGPTQ
jgi:hypothetical protein